MTSSHSSTAPTDRDDFAEWPPEGTVFALDDVDLRITAEAHPLLSEKQSEIAVNWERETTANPSLFDGRMLLMSRLSLAGSKLTGEGHVTPYSAFLWWRRQKDRRGAAHAFAYPVIVSKDGALVAIRMGAHTANPGQVYFAAGSLEPEDIVDGRCDIDSNMRREVMEETGFDLTDADADPHFFATRINRSVPLFKIYRFDMTAEELIARIEAHMEVAEDKEIAGAVAIRSADPKAHDYNVSMLPIIEWYFSRTR